MSDVLCKGLSRPQILQGACRGCTSGARCCVWHVDPTGHMQQPAGRPQGAAHMRKVERGGCQRAKGDEADRLAQPLVAQPAAAAQRPAQLSNTCMRPRMHRRCQQRALYPDPCALAPPGRLCDQQTVWSVNCITIGRCRTTPPPSDLKGGPWYMYPMASAAPSSCSGRASPCRPTAGTSHRQDTIHALA